MNIAGERSIYRYINEAKTWERDGVFNKSEVCYLKALEIFDSYLLTLITSKKIALQLTGAIARFSLTAGWHNDHFDRATIFFLLKNPHETEVAHLWLKKIIKMKFSPERKIRNHSSQRRNSFSQQGENFFTLDKKNLLTQQEDNLITLLAEMDPLSLQLVPLLAEIFNRTQRAGFAANRVFAVMERSADCIEKTDEKSENRTSIFEEKVEHKVFISEKEAAEQYEHPSDETSLMYQYQSDRPFSGEKRLRGSTKRIKKASSSMPYIGQFTTIFDIKSAGSHLFSSAIKGVVLIASLPMNIISILVNVTKYIAHIVSRSSRNIHSIIAGHPDLRNNVRRLVLLTVAGLLLLFFFNTAAHIFRTPKPPVPSTPKVVTEDVEVQVVPQKRFTIQVAAYLIQSHAEKYLDGLVKQGVAEGRINSVEGGGKTWYLIRVGKYETKEIATEYGNKLKSQGIIKDFFVDNSGG
ncbi:MAG: SPOR domain-containing protein [Desulfamplus sp.]|nr:SPOR domain-containing protein [Desulfamplus sp.]